MAAAPEVLQGSGPEPGPGDSRFLERQCGATGSTQHREADAKAEGGKRRGAK